MRPATKIRGDFKPRPEVKKPQVVFSEAAAERIEAAVASGELVDIDQRQFAPTKPVWELSREDQGKKFWEPVEEEKKKEGGVQEKFKMQVEIKKGKHTSENHDDHCTCLRLSHPGTHMVQIGAASL